MNFKVDKYKKIISQFNFVKNIILTGERGSFIRITNDAESLY